MAERLLKLKYIDLLGTDLHHHRHLEHLQSHAVYQKVNEIAAALPLLNDQL